MPVAPAYPQDGSQDLFCGGHTFLPDGDLLRVGGTDYNGNCNLLGFIGHRHAWRLDTSQKVPVWSAASSLDELMGTRRWYPTATLLDTGSVLVNGNVGNADADGASRSEYQPGTGVGNWLSDEDNAEWDPGGLGCADETPGRMFGYPRVHVLASQEAIQTEGHTPVGTHPTRFFEVNPANYVCDQPPTDGPRWKLGSPPNHPHRYGNSVHFITWDEAEGDFSEVVYLIGGADNATTATAPNCTGAVNGAVEKMVDPASTKSWVDVGVPDLIHPRTDHNAVILLDGSILVVGGFQTQSGPMNDTCFGTREAERYETPEVFGNPGAGWDVMAASVAERRYHSVAGLLPDGRVFSAGGRELPVTDAHTVEVFSPPYFFQGTRPEIDVSTLNDPVTDPYAHQSPITFEATLESEVEPDRVALIRNGSSTHAFDPDQRYVQLVFAEPAFYDAGTNKWSISVQAPPDPFVAPSGYYLLTVTDTNDRPSPGAWIRIQ